MPENNNRIKKKNVIILIVVIAVVLIVVAFLTKGLNYQSGNDENNPIVINEFSVMDQHSIYDEDGDFSDFIELYNTSDEEIDITGYFLSDDPNKPSKYTFPETKIPANGYIVVFASGKDKSKGGYIHTNFGLSEGESVVLSNRSGQLISEITIPEFADNVSYGRGLEDIDKWYYYDTPTPGLANTSTPSETVNETMSKKGADVFISEVLSASSKGLKDGYGKYEDWIELYNQTDKDISLEGWYLSDALGNPKKWAFDSSATIKAGERMLIFASGKDKKDSKGYWHTNFKLSKYNENIVLSNGDTILDVLSFGMMRGNVSVGIGGSDDPNKYYYTSPTPGEKNGKGVMGFAPAVNFNYGTGSYTETISLELSTLKNSSDVEIYYTTNGSTPNKSSKKYTKPIKLSKTSVVRAVAYENGKLRSDIVTNNYLFNADHHGLPVVFMSTDDSKLFGSGGIYYGPMHSSKKVESNLTLLEADGTIGFNQQVLLNKHGNMSSLEPQKSFGVYFKEVLEGTGTLEYNLFPDEIDGVTTFHSLILRTSGNDWNDLKCKDGYLQTLAKLGNMTTDRMSYRPAVLYINGEYWGIYNIRDKQNEDYLATHHGVDPDNVDIISFGYGVHSGSYKEWNEFINFISTANLNKKENWEKVERMMDVDNMIDTYLCHIYYGNYDTVNIKWWREKKEGAKWRWLLYDLDYALYVPNQNNLAIVTNRAGHGVGNYFSSALIYNLMQSKYFKERFMERTSEFWKTIFNADYMLKEFDKVYGVIEDEMPNQLKRWDISKSHLNSELAEAKDYIKRRPEIFRKQFKSYFKLSNSELNKLLPKQ